MTDLPTVKTAVQSRPFHFEPDFERVRQFLIETYSMYEWPEHNWEIRRWEGSNWSYSNSGTAENLKRWESEIRLWENTNGKLIGVVHPDGKGVAQMQVYPQYRYLEDTLLDWAEANLYGQDEEGTRHLTIEVFDYDTPRQDMLKRRGYIKMGGGSVTRRRDMRLPIQAVNPVDGYTIRALDPDDPVDPDRLAAVVNAGFDRSTVTGERYRWFEKSPSYRHDLHIVAEAPDGSFVSFSGFTFEPVNRYGVLEPVCTHPDHRRKGLARATILEGLHRISALGAREIYVGTGDDNPSNILYDETGFTEVQHKTEWKKTF